MYFHQSFAELRHVSFTNFFHCFSISFSCLNLLEPSWTFISTFLHDLAEVMHMAQRWKLDTAKMARGPRSFQVVSFWTRSVTCRRFHDTSLIFIDLHWMFGKHWKAFNLNRLRFSFSLPVPLCAIAIARDCCEGSTPRWCCTWPGVGWWWQMHTALSRATWWEWQLSSRLHIVRIAVWMYWMHWNLIRSPLLDIRYRDAAGLFVETCWDQNRRNQQSAVYSHLDSFQMTGGAPTANNVAALRNTAHLSQMCDTGSGYRRGLKHI